MSSVEPGRRQVYDADLQSYFDTIPHEKLMLCRAEADRGFKSVLKLIRMWLQGGHRRTGQRPRRPAQATSRSKQGTPTGRSDLPACWLTCICIGLIICSTTRLSSSRSDPTDRITGPTSGWYGTRLD